jgi:hypothetical protein
MLSRLFGTFPLPDFAALRDDEQILFWKESPTDVQGLKQAITETLTSSMMERTETGTAGKYLPLDVYAKKGFDITLIEHGCNMRMHPVLGKTYRLDIDNVAFTKVREKCRRQVLEMIVNKSKPTPVTAEVKPEKSVDHDDTSDSSKEQFKNDKKHGKKHGKKQKKDKKNKKHGKNKPKNSKKAKKGGSSKKRKSLQKKVQSDATKVLAKVRPLINSMSELMRHEHVDEMPKTIVKQMQAEFEILSNFEKEAREKIGSTATSLTFSMEDVAKASKAICDSMSIVKSMMKQAAKLF